MKGFSSRYFQTVSLPDCKIKQQEQNWPSVLTVLLSCCCFLSEITNKIKFQKQQGNPRTNMGVAGRCNPEAEQIRSWENKKWQYGQAELIFPAVLYHQAKSKPTVQKRGVGNDSQNPPTLRNNNSP